MHPGFITLIGFASLFAGLGLINTRVTRRAAAMGLCPMCAGAATEFVQMSGLEGCFGCTDGTLASHRAAMQAQGRSAWA